MLKWCHSLFLSSRFSLSVFSSLFFLFLLCAQLTQVVRVVHAGEQNAPGEAELARRRQCIEEHKRADAECAENMVKAADPRAVRRSAPCVGS